MGLLETAGFEVQEVRDHQADLVGYVSVVATR